MGDWQQQRRERQAREAKRVYREASAKAQQQWDEPTKSRMNVIMGCIVLPLILLLLGAFAVGAYLSGDLTGTAPGAPMPGAPVVPSGGK